MRASAGGFLPPTLDHMGVIPEPARDKLSELGRTTTASGAGVAEQADSYRGARDEPGEPWGGGACFAPVTPTELVAARERLGLTPDGLAAELNLTPAVIVAWERGRIRPSRRAVQWLTWRTAMLDRDEALAASGLSECAELRALHAGVAGVAGVGGVAAGGSGGGAAVATEPGDARRARMDAILAHLSGCPTCLARRRYIEARFPPMPQPPMAASMRALVWAFDAVGRVRRWVSGALGR